MTQPTHPHPTSRPVHPASTFARIVDAGMEVAIWTMICILACFRIGPSVTKWTAPSTQPVAIQAPGDITLIPMDTCAADREGFEDWCELISREFPQGAIVIVGHGNDTLPGVWSIFPTSDDPPFEIKPFAQCPLSLEWLCKMIRHDDPLTPIVILSCDPHHEKITDIPGVWQATESIWITPDAYESSVVVLCRSLTFPNCVGTLDRFQCFYTEPATKP